MTTTDKKETKKERRQRQLNEHYGKCEALARKIGVENPDGKKISVALLHLEQMANAAATAYCNGEAIRLQRRGRIPLDANLGHDENAWENVKAYITEGVEQVFEFKKIPGFFVNADARGYALKIDNENPQSKALIDELRLHTDWGGYGILSPDLQG
jgi:hypothetical protein